MQLFKSIDFPNEITIEPELLNKRVKGLKEKLEPQEIVNIICYFMMHRGYIPFGDEERTLVKLNGLLPCKYYLKKMMNTIELTKFLIFTPLIYLEIMSHF